MASIAGSFFLGSLLIRVVYCMFLDKLLYWWLNISLYALKIKMIKCYYKPPCLNSLSLEIVSCDKIKRHMTVCLKLLETSFLFFNIQTIFYLKKHWHCFDVTNKQLNIKKIFFDKQICPCRRLTTLGSSRVGCFHFSPADHYDIEDLAFHYLKPHKVNYCLIIFRSKPCW